MARYILALILLLAGGLALVAFNCDSINAPQQRVDLEELNAVTRSISLTQYEEPRAYTLVNFSWTGFSKDRGKKVIVERNTGTDFLVMDTVPVNGGTMFFADQDSLSAGQKVGYRLLFLDQGRASVMKNFDIEPLGQIKFLLQDTIRLITDMVGDGNEYAGREVKTQDKQAGVRIALMWEPVFGADEYEAKIITLKSLAPLPEGDVRMSGVLKPQGNNNIVWDIDAEKLTPGESYILKVVVRRGGESSSRITEGYRLFVLSGVQEETVKNI